MPDEVSMELKEIKLLTKDVRDVAEGLKSVTLALIELTDPTGATPVMNGLRDVVTKLDEVVENLS